MSDNMCSDHELNEERFKRIEQLLDKLSETVDTKNAALSEDIKKLTEDFNSLKEDYIAIKSSFFTTVKILDGVPDAINNLEKTLITLNNNIKNNHIKTDILFDRISNLEAKVSKNDEKSKFDIMAFIKDKILPYIIVSGITYGIMQLIK